MRDPSSIRLPLILAIALHIILFSALFVHLAQPDMRNLQLQPDVDIIKAVAVNPAEIAVQQTRLKVQEQQKQAEQKHQEIQQQQEALKEQQAQAQQRAILEHQKETEAVALQAKKIAQETAQKKAEEAALLEAQAAEAELLQKKQDQAKKEKVIEEKNKQIEAKKQQEEKIATEKAKNEEIKKKQQAKKAAEKKQQEKAAQALKLAQQEELDNQIAAEKKELEAAKTDQQQSEIDKYTALILHTMRQNWIVPEDVNPNISCQLDIRLNADGTVVSVTLLRSSGNAALDNSARLAVFKSSPLPVPADKKLFNQVFKQFNLTVSPKDIQ